MLDTATFSRYLKSKIPLNWHIKWDEVTIPFLLILTSADERHPLVPAFHCTVLTDRNVSHPLTLWEGSRGWILGSERQSEWQEGDGGDGHLELWHFPLMCLVWRPAWLCPSHVCHPNDQIVLAGALIWWMLHCLYWFQQKGAKKKAFSEQKKDLNLSLLHWDE